MRLTRKKMREQFTVEQFEDICALSEKRRQRIELLEQAVKSIDVDRLGVLMLAECERAMKQKECNLPLNRRDADGKLYDTCFTHILHQELRQVLNTVLGKGEARDERSVNT